ncbi:MAG: flavodoxin family protein [Rubrivivax sp.]
MTNVLVVYFSRTGQTRRLAMRLALELQGTPAEIREQSPRSGVFGRMQAGALSLLGREVEIRPMRRDPAAYELVLIGTPMLGWRLAAPVRTFARQWNHQLRHVAFFASAPPEEARVAFEEMELLLGRPPVAELALATTDIDRLDSAKCRSRLRAFAQRLQPWVENERREAA